MRNNNNIIQLNSVLIYLRANSPVANCKVSRGKDTNRIKNLANNVSSIVVGDMSPFSLVEVYRGFCGYFCLHLQCR